MSLIPQSIRVLTLMTKKGLIKPKVVPSFLEQVHQALMVMASKENRADVQVLADSLAATQEGASSKNTQMEAEDRVVEPEATQADAPSVPQTGPEDALPTEEESKQPAPEMQPVAPVPNSDETVTCLACGSAMKLLRPHIRSAHRMDEHQYRQTFGLPPDSPMVAPALSRQKKEGRKVKPVTETEESIAKPEDVIPAVGKGIKRAAAKEKEPVRKTKAATAKSAVTVPDHGLASDETVTCLACGVAMKLLKRHIRAAHQMDERQYREAFGLPHDYPLVAPALSRLKKEAIVQSGMVDKMQQARKAKIAM